MLTKTEQSNKSITAETLLFRLMLYKGEVYRLPQNCRGIRVLSGDAWLTVAGEDIMPAQGEEICFDARKKPVLVSTLRHTPVIFEAWGVDDERVNSVHLTSNSAHIRGFARQTCL